jgi:hypothetical protein
MSNLTLQQIIEVMKTAAATAGFVKIEEKKIVNIKDVGDTDVPAMLIGLSKVEYGDVGKQFLIATVLETYFFNLVIFTNNAENPISTLKTLQDNFLSEFLNSDEMCDYNNNQKIQLIRSDLTNDREQYTKFGGESTTLALTIENTNNFVN